MKWIDYEHEVELDMLGKQSGDVVGKAFVVVRYRVSEHSSGSGELEKRFWTVDPFETYVKGVDIYLDENDSIYMAGPDLADIGAYSQIHDDHDGLAKAACEDGDAMYDCLEKAGVI